MSVFNEVYFDFYDEIEEIFERYEYDYVKVYRDLFCKAKQDVIDLCDYVYGTYCVKSNIRNKKFKKLLKKGILFAITLTKRENFCCKSRTGGDI